MLAQPDPELAMGSGPCPDCTGQLRLPLAPGCSWERPEMPRRPMTHVKNMTSEESEMREARHQGTKLRKVAAEEAMLPMLYAIWLAWCLAVALRKHPRMLVGAKTGPNLNAVSHCWIGVCRLPSLDLWGRRVIARMLAEMCSDDFGMEDAGMMLVHVGLVLVGCSQG